MISLEKWSVRMLMISLEHDHYKYVFCLAVGVSGLVGAASVVHHHDRRQQRQ